LIKVVYLYFHINFKWYLCFIISYILYYNTHQAIITIWHLIRWYLCIYYFSTFIFVYNKFCIMIFVILITFWLYLHSFQYIHICILLFLIIYYSFFYPIFEYKTTIDFSFKTFRYFKIFLNCVIMSTHYYVYYSNYIRL